VGIQTATLHGSVTPNLKATSYRFEYGPTTGYGSSTASQGAGAGATPVPASAALADLAPATTYHYRLVASNGDGNGAAPDVAFTTATVESGGGGGGNAADRTPPVFLAASLSPVTFAVDPAGAIETPVASALKKKKVARGTTFRLQLSEAARVLFTIESLQPGRKVKGHCDKPTRSNGKARPCKRYVLSGRFAANAGTASVLKRFSGKIGTKKLSPGPYRATLTATDAAGNKSAPKLLTFRVVKAR
jgi:hypothetical protein